MSNPTPTPGPAERTNRTNVMVRLVTAIRDRVGRVWSLIRRGLSSLQHPNTLTSKVINAAIIAAGVEAMLQTMDRFGGIELVGQLIELL